MRLGMNILNFGPGAHPATFERAARLAEGLGLSFALISDHVAVTPDVQALYPAPFYDPFTLLAWLTGLTRTIELGTTVTILPYRHPLQTARMAANIDQLSGGRFILGVGLGWLREEVEIFGGNFPRRWTQTREALDVMKALWAQDAAEFHGEFFDFPPVRSYPKPVQKPHPPIVLGGAARNVLKRVVDHADGWLPNRIGPADLEKARKELDRLAAAAGRKPESITISVYGQEPKKEIVRPLFDAGADRVVVRATHVETEAEMGAQLERMAEAVL